MQVQEQVQESSVSWMRFLTATSKTLELSIQVVAVPAAPHSWSANVVDGESQVEGTSGGIPCGKFFQVEVTALDAFNNG